MSLINGISALGTGLMNFSGSTALDQENQGALPRSPTSTVAAPVPRETAPATQGPVVQPAPANDPSNPYGDNPHAGALWAAERAIAKPESGGRAGAQNPVSSAGGLFQITDGTWDAAMQKLGVPLATTQSDRNAQKYNPELNTRAMRQINTEAAAALDSAGLPVTPQTLMAAHRLGPTGAIDAVRAALRDPSAPLVGNGLSAGAVRGNGDVSGLTVGQFLARPYPNAGAA